ncbi:MAG: MAC/perforin domain-containing protein [Pseudomonadota bacterium]
MHRLAAGLTGLALALLAGLPAAADFPEGNSIAFDGSRAGIVLPYPFDVLPSRELRTVEFWFDRFGEDVANGVAKQTLMAVASTTGGLSVVIEEDWDLVLRSVETAGGSVETTVPLDPAMGGVHLAIVLDTYETTVWITAGRETRGVALSGLGLPPRTDDEPMALQIGSSELVGRIGAARVWPLPMDQRSAKTAAFSRGAFAPNRLWPDRLTIAQVSSGLFLRPVVPKTGLWHEHGNVRSGLLAFPKDVPGIPNPAHHGQFEDDEIYFSLTPSFIDENFGQTYTLVDSHGRSLPLARVAEERGVFRVARGSAGGPGETRLLFDTTGHSFTIIEGGSHSLVPGRRYSLLRRPDDGAGSQPFGDAWIGLAKPESFGYSIHGCYDSRRMSPFNFAWQGCKRGFFREPPPHSFRYTDGDFDKIIPWGWKFGSIPLAEGHSYSTIAIDGSDVGRSIAGSQSYGFELANIGWNRNETVKREQQDIREKKRIRTYQSFTDRRHSIVLDPRNVQLDQCFIKDVMRAAFGLAERVPVPPRWFDPEDTDGGHCTQDLRDPISPEALIDRYGTHYAYAITYGARALSWTDIDANSLSELNREERDVASGLDYQINASVNVPGTPVTVNSKTGASLKSEDSRARWNDISNSMEFNERQYFCVGGGDCRDGSVSATSDPVPIYLDLRPISDLLGPPFFLDPDIAFLLRRRVSQVFDALHAETPVATPMIAVYDVRISDITCDVQQFDNTTDQARNRFGPFAPGGPFERITVPPDLLGPTVKTSFDARRRFNDSLCDDLGRDDLVLQVVGEDAETKPTLMIHPAPPRFPSLVDGSGSAFTIETPFISQFQTVSAQTGVSSIARQGFRFQLRLRPQAEADEPGCAPPCASWVRDDVDAVVSVGNVVPDFGMTLYPYFDYIELDDIPDEGLDRTVTVAGGFARFPASAERGPVELLLTMRIRVKPQPIAARLGFP